MKYNILCFQISCGVVEFTSLNIATKFQQGKKDIPVSVLKKWISIRKLVALRFRVFGSRPFTDSQIALIVKLYI